MRQVNETGAAMDEARAVSDPKSVVNSVLRACRILELVAAEGPAVSLSRVADAVGLSRPTAHRLLTTLVMAGWVRRTKAGHYALTMRAFSVGSSASAGTSLLELATPTVERLAQQTGDTAYLLVPDEGRALCLTRVEGPYPVRVHNINTGDAVPLLSGAAPLAMVAHSPGILQTALDKRAAAIPATVARLEAARRDGYVVSSDDLTLGVSAVGAAVFDSSGEAVAGVSVTGINDRLGGEHLAEVIRLVRLAAAEVSRLLGYDGDLVSD